MLESRGRRVSVRCTWALAWCVQDHVAGGLQCADTPLVVFVPPVAAVTLALLTSRWQISRPSGSLIPPPPQALTLPLSHRGQLPENGHGCPAPLRPDAQVPMTQARP